MDTENENIDNENNFEGGLNESQAAEALVNLFNPQEEQVEEDSPEQENPDQETDVVDEENIDDSDDSDIELDEDSEDEEDVGDSDEDDNDSEDEDELQTFTVKVNGEDYEVNIDELKKSYGLEKDYTKKSQALADEKKIVEQTKTQYEEQLNIYVKANNMFLQDEIARYQKVDAELKQMDRNEDPQAYMYKAFELQEAEKAFISRRDQLNAAISQQEVIDKAKQEENMRAVDSVLTEKLEGYKDDKKGTLNKIVDYALEIGVSQERLNSINSADDFLILEKAMKYDKYQKDLEELKKKKSVKKKTPSVKTNKSKSKGQAQEMVRNKQKAKLKGSGKLSDAAALLKDLL